MWQFLHILTIQRPCCQIDLCRYQVLWKREQSLIAEQWIPGEESCHLASILHPKPSIRNSGRVKKLFAEPNLFFFFAYSYMYKMTRLFYFSPSHTYCYEPHVRSVVYLDVQTPVHICLTFAFYGPWSYCQQSVGHYVLLKTWMIAITEAWTFKAYERVSV